MQSQIKLICRLLVASSAIVSMISCPAFSQTWGEVFQQKKTQRRYLIEHIAALKLYAGYAWKGYAVADDGLRIIHAITDGEFSLHDLFFKGLKMAGPAVSRNPLVPQIIQIEGDILSGLSSLNKIAADEPHRSYILLVRANLITECTNDLWELVLILSSNRVDLSERERLERLQNLHDSILSKRSYTYWFASQAAQARSSKRQLETYDLTLKDLYEIP